MKIERYSKIPQLVFGFHGCDKSVRDKILNSDNEHITVSLNDYDWLGNGAYFWLNDPIRAFEWAEEKHRRNPEKLKTPSVIGAIIDLGECLNLSERTSIENLRDTYIVLKRAMQLIGRKMPTNETFDKGGYPLMRKLDCAVIESLHTLSPIKYQTVFGFFSEGEPAYEGAGFARKSHAQICVRDMNCIKGYFLPRILKD